MFCYKTKKTVLIFLIGLLFFYLLHIIIKKGTGVEEGFINIIWDFVAIFFLPLLGVKVGIVGLLNKCRLISLFWMVIILIEIILVSLKIFNINFYGEKLYQRDN